MPCPCVRLWVLERLESSGMRSPAKSSAVQPWCSDAGSGVMLIPHGCCSTLMLLLHPSPAGARNGCQSFLPMLDRQQRSSGCSGFAVPGWCPPSGQGEGRQCPLIQSCLGSPSLLCPRILSQKWEKNSPSQGLPPTSAGGCAPKSRGKQAKTSQEPKKKKTKLRGFLEEHDPLWLQTSSHRLHRSPWLQGRARVGTPPRAVQTELGSPHKCQGTPNPPRGVFPFRSPPRKREARAGQYSPRRRELLSSGTES